MKKSDSKSKDIRRPPIVVVVGHIDHGKTTLLDAIRKTKVAEKESGGITQHIGAYEIEHNGKKITFIDTPGHEAFTKMRSRGTEAADIGILVVAADEGVKPQTQEAIKILENSKIPYLVAINKIDRPGADANKVKQELAQANVLTESWGGKIPSVEISAKHNKNLDELLELILLMAEMEELSADEGTASGIVIESHRDALRGNTATLLILNGKMSKGNALAIGSALENIKILENFLNRPINEACYSMPVRISSLTELPEVGEKFLSFSERKTAESYVKELKKTTIKKDAVQLAVSEEENPVPALFIIIKTDVSGSREALEGMLEKLSDQVKSTANGENQPAKLVILKSEVGDVNESDIKTAAVSKQVIIAAFKVKAPQFLKDLADRQGTKILQSEIIYDLFDAIKSEFSKIMPPEIKRIDTGRAKVLALFKRDGAKQIIGGKVTGGKITRGGVCEIERGKEIIGRGKIRDLQHMKKSVDEVKEGMEFGTMLEAEAEVKENDMIIIFSEEIIYKKL